MALSTTRSTLTQRPACRQHCVFMSTRPATPTRHTLEAVVVGCRSRAVVSTQWRVACRATQTEQPTPQNQSSKYEEITVTLKKPVGLVFCQSSKGGPVYVDEVTPGGNADQCGLVRTGDILAKCSAVALKEDANTDYSHGQTPYKDFERLTFDCLGQDFKTVMSALKSNNTRWGITDVTMVFHRPQQATATH